MRPAPAPRPEEINKLLKMHRGMADMMKMMGKQGRGGLAGKLGSMFGIGGGAGAGMPQPTPEQIEQMQKQFGVAPGAPGSTVPVNPPPVYSAVAHRRVCPDSARKFPASVACRVWEIIRSGKRNEFSRDLRSGQRHSVLGNGTTGHARLPAVMISRPMRIFMTDAQRVILCRRSTRA